MENRLHKTAKDTSVAKYCIGFAVSILLTLAMYYIVVDKMLEGTVLLVILGSLALIQATVQLIFFLHLGRGRGSRLKVAAFFSMLSVLVIVMAGSIWIMHHLDYNMMNLSPEALEKRLEKEAGF